MRKLALFLLCAAGCSSGSLVVFTVDATAPLSDVARLHVAVTQGARVHEVDVPLAEKSIPPSHSFAVSFASPGHIHVHVEAFDSAAAMVASVDGEADVVSGRVDVPLHFQVNAPGDLAVDAAWDSGHAEDGGGGSDGSDGNGDGGGGDSDGATDDGGPTPCGTGTHSCGAQCVASTDVSSCGGSCDPCPLPANGNHATCDGTSCGFECNAGFHTCGADCVADNDVAHCGTACGACLVPANASAATCDGTSCGLLCAAGYHECGGACVRSDDPANCGASCTACDVPTGGSATCDGTQCGGSCPAGQKLCAGACIPTANSCAGSCPGGAHDCSGLCSSNSSTNSCGAACTPCPAPANSAGVSCDGTNCGFTCKSGYHKCGATCLSDTDVGSCGGSCTGCPAGPANSSPICTTGACGWQCNSNFKQCGSACIPSSNCCLDMDCNGGNHVAIASCISGTCQIATCSAGFGNCDSSYANGCELNTGNSDGQTNSAAASTINHCGSCGGTCPLLAGTSITSCASGACAVGACSGGRANCNGTQADGCESDLTNSDGQSGTAINHCGSCGGACPLTANTSGTHCSASACQVGSCASGFLDCDGSYANGCELNIGNSDGQTNSAAASNINHCGSCGGTCPLLAGTSTTSCASGACAIGACAGGRANCNGTQADGCESDLTNSDGQLGAAINHCGSCSGACPLTANASGTHCSASACQVDTCASGFLDCDGSYANGCEVNGITDNNHCLGCGTVCAANSFCSAAGCTPFKRVFVTSTTYDGNLGGLPGADAKCQAQATAAGLSGTYKAWLSTGAAASSSAAARLTHSTSPYMLVDRTRVADNWTALTSGSLLHAINVTELGTASSEVARTCAGATGIFHPQVWTATDSSGNFTIGSSNTPSTFNYCNTWSSNAHSGTLCSSTSPCAVTGSLSQSGSDWSQACGQTFCNDSFALYCLEQ